MAGDKKPPDVSSPAEGPGRYSGSSPSDFVITGPSAIAPSPGGAPPASLPSGFFAPSKPSATTPESTPSGAFPESTPSGAYAGSTASGSYQGASRSGIYVSRPSIARFIEATAASIRSETGQFRVRLDVLSDHQLYAGALGTLRGVFVVTAAPAKIGSPVTLDVVLPWEETIEVTGDVEWVLDVPRASVRHRPGMGVRFDVLPHQLVLIERAMILRAPMEVPRDVRRW